MTKLKGVSMTEERDLSSFIKFDPNDFIIRVSPYVEDGEWTGDIDVGMLTTDYNDLNKEDYAHLRMLTEMLISSIPLMESNAEFRHSLLKIVDETYGDEEPEPRVDKRDGNVLTVNF